MVWNWTAPYQTETVSSEPKLLEHFPCQNKACMSHKSYHHFHPWTGKYAPSPQTHRIEGRTIKVSFFFLKTRVLLVLLVVKIFSCCLMWLSTFALLDIPNLFNSLTRLFWIISSFLSTLVCANFFCMCLSTFLCWIPIPRLCQRLLKDFGMITNFLTQKIVHIPVPCQSSKRLLLIVTKYCLIPNICTLPSAPPGPGCTALET